MVAISTAASLKKPIMLGVADHKLSGVMADPAIINLVGIILA
jgi:hypothetical protein